MMTQTHMLLASALYCEPRKPLRNVVVLTGSFIPDFALYALFAWSRLNGISDNVIFNELYWSNSWQSMMAPGNSIPMFLAGGMVGMWIYRRGRWEEGRLSAQVGLLIALFCAAALWHVLLDFPLHVDDAHQHFWPLSEWKFVSAVSYWDDRYYAGWVRPVEFAIGVGALLILLRKFTKIWVRVLLSVALALNLAVPAYFWYLSQNAL